MKKTTFWVLLAVAIALFTGIVMKGPEGTVEQRRARAEHLARVELLKLYPDGAFNLSCEDPGFDHGYHCTVTRHDSRPYTIWCNTRYGTYCAIASEQ